MLATRIFARPAKHFRKFHYSVPSHVEEQSRSPQPHEDLIKLTAETPSTNRGTVQQPYQIFESWKPNTFYSPLDFLRSRRAIAHRSPPTYSSVGPGAKEALFSDAFRQLDVNPIAEANNPELLGGFITRMGKIHPRARTKLSWRSQRMVARAIKRAKQKGILPILNRGMPTQLV